MAKWEQIIDFFIAIQIKLYKDIFIWQKLDIQKCAFSDFRGSLKFTDTCTITKKKPYHRTLGFAY